MTLSRILTSIVLCSLVACAPMMNTSPVVQVKTSGGLCVYGACESTTLIYPNGTVIQKTGDKAPVEKKLTVEQMTMLEAAIKGTDFAAIRTRPFTDTCPIAYDGQAYTYTFWVNGKEESFYSCEFVLDQAVFTTIQGLISE